MATIGEKALEEYVKNSKLPFNQMAGGCEWMTWYEKGYAEAMRWRDLNAEIPCDGQEIICKNGEYKQIHIFEKDGRKNERWLKLFFSYWRPIE